MSDSEPNSGELPLVEPLAEVAEEAQPGRDSVPPEAETGRQEAETVAQEETREQPGTLEQPEEHAAMLEVHPPHEPVHSWKDAFIHIAIIVVGLLIAVGLDRMVEFFHHQHQVAETRKALEIERQININHYAMGVEEFHRFVPKLQTNLAIYQFLKAHPHAPREQWPGRLSMYFLGASLAYADARWNTAKQDNVLVLMPDSEVQEDSVLYRQLAGLNANIAAKEDAAYESIKLGMQTPDTAQMSPEQIDREIEATTSLLSLYFRGVVAQRVLSDRFPDFKPAITYEDGNRLFHFQGGAEDDVRKVDEMKQRLRREDEAVAGGEQSGTP